METLYTPMASAIYNDIIAGLNGYHQTLNLSIELLEQDIVETRMATIKAYLLKGILPIKDLLVSLNCVPVDCKDMDRCKCLSDFKGEEVAHFEIPQVAFDYGGDEIIHYIGTTDRLENFVLYTNPALLKYNRYRTRARKKPFVYLDLTPNENGNNDGFIFNAPLIKRITVVYIPKDPRAVMEFGCCPEMNAPNMSFIDAEVKQRVTEMKIKYYRLLATPITPNTQAPA